MIHEGHEVHEERLIHEVHGDARRRSGIETRISRMG